MQLKNYQITAIKKLLSRSKGLLSQSGKKKIVFKSPTGSGKTIMMAEFLKQLIDDGEVSTPLSFIWTAPRKLHQQSKSKLEKYFDNSQALQCSDFEKLTDKQIGENEILFLNWESINKKDKNTIIKENEREFYLGKIIDNTKLEGRNIILVIDESHYHETEIADSLRELMGPKLAIEVSATPLMTNVDEIVSVPLEDVKMEGMIKKAVILNPDFENVLLKDNVSSSLSEGSDIMVLEEALKKRKELTNSYQDDDKDINPLLLIQLPDRKTQREDQLKNDVIRYLKDAHKITTKNGKLAIYLSEEKENLDNIAKINHETEVLIFKQAIALGWDCPRAQILVLFRDWKSLVFSIQTVGRIMRMPEPSAGHYENENLNLGYVYTNLDKINIQEDVAKSYVTIYTSKRIQEYKPIKLKSVYRLRQREKTRLSSLFIKIFMDKAGEYEIESKIKLKGQKLELAFISSYQAEGVDDLTKEEIQGDVSIDVDNEVDLQKLFDFFVRDNLSPFYPEDRSIGRVKEAIYYLFSNKFKMDYSESFSEILSIVLSDKNRQHFINLIDLTKERYIEETKKRQPKLQRLTEWEVPEKLNFGSDHTVMNVKKSVMQLFYYDNNWKTEEAFIQFLENSESVKWWFKNGERDSTFFAVPYIENEKEAPFYVDFIVMFEDKTIGLYDTKSGRTIVDAKSKSDGLIAYIKKQVEAGRKMTGGIVTNTKPKDYLGRWLYYKDVGVELTPDDFSNWDTLDI